jgi:DNA invertase Pin-like site-specific DNA recombinase
MNGGGPNWTTMVAAGIDQPERTGERMGGQTAGKLVPEMKQLRKDGMSKRAIAKQLGVSRTSVIRLLRPRKRA